MASIAGSANSVDHADTSDPHLTPGDGHEAVELISHLTSSPGKHADESNLHITLHQAAREGNVDFIRRLLDHMSPMQVKKKINQKDEDHSTPLHYAARYHNFHAAKVLLDRGANVNAKAEDGITPLHAVAHYLRSSKVRKHHPGYAEELNQTVSPKKRKKSPVLGHFWKEEKRSDQFGEDEGAKNLTNEPSTHDSDKPTYDLINYLVAKGARVNGEDDYGLTPLHYAARRGNTPAAKVLIMCKSINIEAKDKQDQTPLHAACTYDHKDIVQLLIDNGADLRAMDEELCTPLHLACMIGNYDVVSALFNAGEKKDGWVTMSQMVSHQNVDESTPLHIAVENKHYDIAKLCIEKGSDINTHNSNWNTPLHLAAESGEVTICELLLDNHAKIDAVNNKLMTPLHLAAEYDQSDVCTFLIRKGAMLDRRDEDDFTPLLLAVVYGNERVLTTLLDAGADASAADKKDKNAIFWAAAEDHLGSLEILLKNDEVVKRGLINATDAYDNTALHVAAEKGFVRIVQCLLEFGAARTLKNEEEQTAIHLACRFGRINVVRELVKHDVNCIRDEDQDSNTPLHIAALYGHSQVAMVLIDSGADPEDRNCSLWTPLDCAAAKGWVKTARVLLEQDSPIDPMDKTKNTPLLLASARGHTDVVKLLLQWNATVSHRDSNGNNCLDVAIDNNHKDVALAIISSDKWDQALRNETFDLVTKMRNTPMRKFIRKMPDIAQKVFSRCTTASSLNPEHPKYSVSFTYEFLDDMYQDWHEIPGTVSSDSSHDSNAFDDENRLRSDAMPYTTDSNIMKQNHPLMIMVTSKREELLAHPLVTSLLRHKWNNYGRYFYYINLCIYLVFLSILTAFILVTPRPSQYYDQHNITSYSSCDSIRAMVLAVSGKPIRSSLFELISKYFIIGLCMLQLLRELFQIYQAKLAYLGVENAIEWIMYAFSLYLVIDQNSCQKETNLRDVVQWQLGAIAIFLAWIDLILFIRKVPRFGIYVVMFTDVLNTFMRFSFVFLLFIIAFGLSFHVLLANQVPFNSVGASLLKTSVMMIGEFEFDAMFNSQYTAAGEGDHTLRTYFDVAVYVIFVLFLVVMSIILMNLLVGLAVDDIKAVQDQAVLKRLAMQVELALDVESFVPNFIRRRFAIRTQQIRPNRKPNLLKRFLNMESSLSQAEICAALNPQNDRLGELHERQQKMDVHVKKMKSDLKDVGTEVQKLVAMMSTMLEHEKIKFHAEDVVHQIEVA